MRGTSGLIRRSCRIASTLPVLVLLALVATPAAPAAAKHESCRPYHGARYCAAREQRHTLRVVRHLQLQEVARAHVRFHRSYYRGWDVRRLAAASRWERQRLHWLREQPTWLPSDPVALARTLAAQRGWVGSQWASLRSLWMKESGFQTSDPNSSGCDGIPQACPGSKMGCGTRLRDAACQIRWGLSYIASRYGSPAVAWAHSLATDPGGWY